MNNAIRNKLFLMMVLEIGIWGAWQVKIYPYMGMLHFTPGQMAWVGSVFGIASLVGIFFSNQFADRNFSAERFLAFSHLIGGLALLGASTQKEFLPFFVCFLIYSVLYVPTISVANSMAFANLKDPAKDFGFVRMGGTVGWIMVSWPYYFIFSKDATADQTKWIFIVAAILSFALAAFALTLPHIAPRKDAAGMDRLAWVKASRLLAIPYVFLLFIVTFIDSTIHNGYFVVIDNYLTKGVGISDNVSQAVTSLGQVAEILAMLILGSVLARLGWKRTLLLGIFGHVARFTVFAFFQDQAWIIVAVQLLHGICYAFFFATVYIFVDAVFPPDVRTSAQGLFNLLILGAGMVMANQIFPRLMAAYTENGVINYQKLFMVPTAMAIFAMALLLFFKPPTERPEAVGAANTPH